MPNATLRASVHAMPSDRRAFLRTALTAGAVAALPTAALAASSASPIDQRSVDLWNRRKRVREAIERIYEQVEAAEAQLPEWARSGPKYLYPKAIADLIPSDTAGWPAIEGVEHPKIGEDPVLVRPNHEDIWERFRSERLRDRGEAERDLIASLVALEERCKRQKAEKERVGYTAAQRRYEDAFELLEAIDDKIEARMFQSPYAAVAALMTEMQIETDNERLLLASLTALRPLLSGSLAEDVDRQLAEAKEEEDA